MINNVNFFTIYTLIFTLKCHEKFTNNLPKQDSLVLGKISKFWI